MATTCPIDFDVAKLRESVRSVYTRVAGDPGGDFHFHRGAAYAVRLLGYDPVELEAVPERAKARFAGVGNPLSIGPIAAGETVLDHACGAGMDLLLSALRSGPTGRAIGVDATPAMRECAEVAAREAHLEARIEIRGGLFEELPVDDASIDVVISNGVLNLALPEEELATLSADVGLRDGHIQARFRSFAEASAEAKVSRDLQIGAVNFFARKPF